jgi:hypothetical protein
MDAPSIWTVDRPTLFLGALALLSATVLAILVVMGLRALLLGRDTVWECSWRTPPRVLLWWDQIRTTQPRQLVDSAIRASYRAHARQVALLQQRPQAARRPIRSHHYLTVGERARLRAANRQAA